MYNGYSNSCEHFLSYNEPIQNEDRFNIFVIFLLHMPCTQVVSIVFCGKTSLHFFITLFTKRSSLCSTKMATKDLANWFQHILYLFARQSMHTSGLDSFFIERRALWENLQLVCNIAKKYLAT